MSTTATTAVAAVAKLAQENEDLRQIVIDCIDSLQYVQSVIPYASGYGVREQRIAAAQKVLG